MIKTNQTAFVLNHDLHPLELLDALSERLNKANSLAEFALTESMCEHLNQAVHYYLWALSQLIQEANVIYQKLENLYLKE